MDNKVRLYAIKDTIAEEFGPIYTAKNDAVASRKFAQLISEVNQSSQGDFVLHFMGVYDVESGGIFSEVREVKLEDIASDLMEATLIEGGTKYETI